MVRGGVGLSMCLVVGVLFVAATASASAARPCAGHVSASRYNVTLVGSGIRVTASTWNAFQMQLHPARPELGCARAVAVVHAYLTAKLQRPLRRCTIPALQGKGCRVGEWFCYSAHPAARTASPEQVCTHFVYGRGGGLRRLTHIDFRETDHDRG